jgi:hypothetical protein
MTDGEFIDPLRDPRFPERPQSEDFWKLSEILLKHDGAAGEGEGVESVIHRYLDDEDALIYMATHRAMRITSDPETRALLAAIFIDGFMAGAAFTKSDSPRGASNDDH